MRVKSIYGHLTYIYVFEPNRQHRQASDLLKNFKGYVHSDGYEAYRKINVFTKSLNGWIKEELFLEFNLGKSNDVHQTIKDNVYYFNNERPSYALK